MSKQKVSLFMDGEASEFESVSVLKQISKDSSLERCWADYHMIGDVLRNDSPVSMSSGFVSRLSSVLDEEISPVSRRYRSNDRTGFALAASISAVALVGLLQFGQSAIQASTSPSQYETNIQLQQIAMANALQDDVNDSTVNFEMSNQTVAYASFEGQAVNNVPDTASTGDVESSVYDYLVNYSQYAVAAPLAGSISEDSLLSFNID